jgi:hypothetical protein
VLTTADLEVFQSGPNAGQRALISAVRTLIGAASPSSITTAAKATLNGSATTTTSSTQETNGRYSLLASGAYHKFTVPMFIANQATYYKGLQVWASPDGEA